MRTTALQRSTRGSEVTKRETKEHRRSGQMTEHNMENNEEADNMSSKVTKSSSHGSRARESKEHRHSGQTTEHHTEHNDEAGNMSSKRFKERRRTHRKSTIVRKKENGDDTRRGWLTTFHHASQDEQSEVRYRARV